MKGILVALNASFVHTNLAVRLLKEVTDKPVDILEMTVNESKTQLLSKIFSKQPDFIMYSTYIWNWTTVQSLGYYIHKAAPEIKQYLGGPEVTYDPQERMEKHTWIDGVLTGEGELTFDDFLSYVCGRLDAEKVAGLCYRDGTSIRKNPKPSTDTNLDGLPNARYETAMDHRIVYYESMRGCPYACSYCLSSKDEAVRYRSVADLKRDMASIFQTGTRLIKFVDRSFHIHPHRTREIIQFFIDKAPENCCIHFEMNLEHMNEDLINLLNSAPKGRFQIEAGIQSTNPRVNHLIHRSTNIGKMKNVIDRIHREKVHIHVDLIVGLPEETLESFLDGFDEVALLRAKRIQIGFLKLLPGTELKERAEEFGIIYEDEPPYEVIRTPALSSQEKITLKFFETIVETYYDEDAFETTLDELRRRGLTLSRVFYKMAQDLQKRVSESPLKGQNGKYRYIYDYLKSEQLLDREVYDAIKWDFYRNEDRYIGKALGIEDSEIQKSSIVDFLQRHPDFVRESNILKASKQIRGIYLKNTIRYIFYVDGKYIKHVDERRNNG